MYADAAAKAADKPTESHMSIAHSTVVYYLSAVQMANCAQTNAICTNIGTDGTAYRQQTGILLLPKIYNTGYCVIY